MSVIFDVVRLGWIAIVACALVRTFGAGRRGVSHDGAARMALIARALVLAVLAAAVLPRLHIFNAVTLLGVCLAWPLARWLKRHDWAAEHALRTAIRGLVLDAVQRSEQPVASWSIVRRFREMPCVSRARLRAAQRTMEDLSRADVAIAAAACACLTAAVYLRFGPVLGETRLASPELYGTLLGARQILFNTPAGVASVSSVIAATLSTGAAVNAIHVVRFVDPVAGVTLVVASALLVRRATGNAAAAVITLALLTPPLDGGDLQLATAFVVLAALAASFRTPASPHGALACLAVAALAAPHGDPAHAPQHLLRVALAVSAGLAYARVLTLARARGFRIPALDPAAAPLACVIVALMIPTSARGLFLEYPSAQRNALEIASTFTRGKWLIVAPLEQLSESYGRGWYEEAAAFVDRYGERAADSAFRFDYAVDDVFVFVEKRPFRTFRAEAAAVPFSTLVDPTYRHYRSFAGRASLEARLLAMCERYARSHAGASVYYDDDDVTIFRFHLDS